MTAARSRPVERRARLDQPGGFPLLRGATGAASRLQAALASAATEPDLHRVLPACFAYVLVSWSGVLLTAVGFPLGAFGFFFAFAGFFPVDAFVFAVLVFVFFLRLLPFAFRLFLSFLLFPRLFFAFFSFRLFAACGFLRRAFRRVSPRHISTPSLTSLNLSPTNRLQPKWKP